MEKLVVLLALSFCGCGGRVAVNEEAQDIAPDDAMLDAGDEGVERDTGAAGSNDDAAEDASLPVVETSVPDTTPAGEAPRQRDGEITSLDICPSTADSDKIIAHAFEGLRPFPPSAIKVSAGFTKCSDVFPGSSETGEAIFTSTCGLQTGNNVVIQVGAGVIMTSGVPLKPGWYIYAPSGTMGRVCGVSYRPTF